MAMEIFGPIVVSSVVANITMREFAGYRLPYEMPVFPAVTGVKVLLFVVLGLLSGALAPYFLRLLAASKKRFAMLPLPFSLRLALGGADRRHHFGLVAADLGQWLRGRELAAASAVDVGALLTVFLFKIIATAATTGSGAVGGIFTPPLFVGAVLGGLFGMGVHAIWPDSTSAPLRLRDGRHGRVPRRRHARAADGHSHNLRDDALVSGHVVTHAGVRDCLFHRAHIRADVDVRSHAAPHARG